jgi:DNA-binding NarL/FixJ family response regulator
MSQPLDKLSPREREVMELVSQGWSKWEVARRLDPPIGEETVKTHLKSIFTKLDVQNRTQAVTTWLQRGGS